MSEFSLYKGVNEIRHLRDGILILSKENIREPILIKAEVIQDERSVKDVVDEMLG